MKALFTKDCLDWVGHLIIQATIWKQRSKLKAKCGLLRKKLLVCVLQILLHACIFQSNVVFCSCKAKAKWSKHALYTFNLTFNYIKCAWGNISVIKSGPSFISKSASSKKKRKEKRSECDHVIRRRWCFWLPPRAQPKEDEAVCVCTERQPQGCRGEDAGNKINNSDRHWVCSRSIIQGSGGSSIAYHYDIKGSCRLESPGRHQRQVSPRHAW